MLPTRPTSFGHIAVLHEDPALAEATSHMLRGLGHRVNVITPGRRVLQAILDGSPDLVLVSMSIPEPSALSVLRGVRQALGADVAMLVLYRQQAGGVPNEADEVIREPVDQAELEVRVSRLLRTQAERRALLRKTQELLGLYKMSWSPSRWPAAPTLSSGTSRGSPPSC